MLIYKFLCDVGILEKVLIFDIKTNFHTFIHNINIIKKRNKLNENNSIKCFFFLKSETFQIVK